MTKVQENWFKSWFNTKYYHILYKHRDNVEANLFIGKLVDKIQLTEGMRVADICCGKGRHSIELSNYQLNVWGMDLSENSILEAQATGNDRTKFNVHDMRDPFPESDFDAIFNLFTSFGYFNDAREDLKCLSNIYNSLKSGGTFVQDYIHAEYFTKDFPIDEVKVIDQVNFGISKYVEDGHIVKKIDITDNNYQEVFYERVKIYTLEEMVNLHKKAGFKVDVVLGDYHLNAFSAENSQRIILISRKL